MSCQIYNTPNRRRFYYKLLAQAAVIASIVLALIFLLRSDVQIAWNSGFYERRTEQLREFALNILDGKEPDCCCILDAETKQQLQQKQSSLITTKPVSELATKDRLRKDGIWLDVYLYPVLLSNQIAFKKNAETDVKPLVLLLLVTPEDKTSFEQLCKRSALSKDQQRTTIVEYMNKASEQYRVGGTFALMSDGSVTFLSLVELEDQLSGY